MFEENLEEYYEDLEEETIQRAEKREKKTVVPKMIVDGAGLKTVSLNRKFRDQRNRAENEF